MTTKRLLRSALLAAAAIAVIAVSPAEAKRRVHAGYSPVAQGTSCVQNENDGKSYGCPSTSTTTWSGHNGWAGPSPSETHAVTYAQSRGEVIGTRPGVCTDSRYCGCGVSIWAFGHSVRDLWLVKNWRRFPRAEPAAGRVVLFGNYHVAGIESVDANGNAVLYDPNSGGGLTRRHTVNIHGLEVRDPHA